MAEIKWIKITTDIFDDEKIKLIDTMPDRDALIVIWFKLLTVAGKKNSSGLIFLSEKMPYTDEMLATIFNRPLNTLRLALKTFQDFGMIEINENQVIAISNWEKHQNIDGMDKIKEQNRLRQAEYRRKQKLMLSDKSNVTSRDNNAIDKNRLDKDKEKNKKLSSSDKLKLEIDKLDITDKLKESLKEFVDYRKELKKTITLRSIKMTLKQLADKSMFENEEHLIESIEYSISKCYQGIYASPKKSTGKFKSTETNFNNIV